MDDDRAQVVALIAQQPASPTDHDGVMGSLRRLCAAAAQALSASGAAVAVMAGDGTRSVAVASDPVSERVEELQFMLGEGPGIDAFANRRPVLVPDLVADAMARWPVEHQQPGGAGHQLEGGVGLGAGHDRRRTQVMRLATVTTATGVAAAAGTVKALHLRPRARLRTQRG